jgi:hypothetical protein
MRDLARTRNISWERVITADAEPADSLHRARLASLAADALADVETAIRVASRPVLLINPGLLARYRQTAFIDRLRESPGPGVWLLVAGQDRHKPMIDSIAVPLLSPNHWGRLNRYWIKNQQRGAAA